MQFNKIIGQENVIQQLTKAVNLGRIPHAQLFYGPEGCGSLPLAIAYAQYIACKNKIDGDSCGTCSSCIKFEKLAHPDLHFAFPVNTSKDVNKDPASDDYLDKWREQIHSNPYFISSQWYDFIGIENKQGVISKKESEAIIRKLSLKSFESDYKFLILWLPEKMNATSANMLLKLIEEPPQKTVFLLISEIPEDVLLTISSRTQPVKLSRIESFSLIKALEERFHIGSEEAKNIARLANGNFILALETFKATEENIVNLKNFTSIMRLCYSRDITEINGWVENMSALGREKLKSFFKYALRIIRENFIMNLKNDELIYLSDEEAKFSEKFYPFINGRNIIEISNEFNKASADIERNANAKIVLFDMALKIVKLIRK